MGHVGHLGHEEKEPQIEQCIRPSWEVCEFIAHLLE